MLRSVRVITLITLATGWLSGCSGSTGTSNSQPPPPAAATWGSEPTTELGNVFENNLVFGLDEAGYKLCTGSPAIGAGRDAGSTSGADLWGDEVTSANVGAYGGDGEDCTPGSGLSQSLHLFLLAGQSNMAGRGELEDTDRTPHPRVFVLDKNDDWVIATEPLHYDKPQVRGTGPGLAFGKEIAERNPDIRVGLVPTAVGGSGIQTWEPGGYHEQTGLYPWDDAVHRLRVAMKSGELKAILWHQGESDSRPERAPLYEARLHDLIRRFRDLAGDDQLPFIIGQLGQFKEWTEERELVNAVHESVPMHFEHTRFISSDGLDHIGDKTHFDAESARELGRRYAAAHADILQTTTQ